MVGSPRRIAKGDTFGPEADLTLRGSEILYRRVCVGAIRFQPESEKQGKKGGYYAVDKDGRRTRTYPTKAQALEAYWLGGFEETLQFPSD